MAKSKQKREYVERIRYVKNWNDQGEHFVFEGKWSDETEWTLDSAFKMIDTEQEKGALIHFTALTKIRQLMHLHIPVYFE